MKQPVLLGNKIYARSGYESRHPMAWPKTAPTLALIRTFDWYDEDNYVECPKVTPRRIKAIHDPAYVDAAFDAEVRQKVSTEMRTKYGLGTGDTPIFPRVIERASVACGAAIRAANLLVDGGIVHSPLGGAHHAEPARASGFGYFNDIVLGIRAMLDMGLERVAYVDIDAHHGNAVEAAFAYNPNVLTLSIHQENCWPYGGIESDLAYGIVNLPVPAGLNDSEMNYLLHEVVLPQLDRFNPDAIVVQAGADSLRDDLMMDLDLSSRAYFETIDALRHMAPRIWVTGGGGYNPWAVVRCWAGIWCVLNERDPADEPVAAKEKDLIDFMQQWPFVCEPPSNWLRSLADEPRPGEVRHAIVECAKRLK